MPSACWQSSLDTLLLRRWSGALVDLCSAAESVAARGLGFMGFGLLIFWSSMAKYVCAFGNTRGKGRQIPGRRTAGMVGGSATMEVQESGVNKEER